MLKLGKARQSIFALITTSYSLYEVNESGWPEQIGLLHQQPHQRFLLTTVDGFSTFDGLPYFLNAALPGGFLGRILGERIGDEINVGKNPEKWSADEALRYLLNCGEDLPGNLILGESSAQRFIDLSNKHVIVDPDDYDEIANTINQADFGYSSVAGEHPKFALVTRQGDKPPFHAIIKYSGKLTDTSPASVRYRDLLIAEHLSLQTLPKYGVDASESRLFSSERLYLEVIRFDRIGSIRPCRCG